MGRGPARRSRSRCSASSTPCRRAAPTGDVLDHLDGYLDAPQSPALVRAGLHAAGAVPGGAHVAAAVAHGGVRRMATRFIAGQSAGDAAVALEALWRDGFAATVDLLGEKTLTAADADHYAARVADRAGRPHRRGAGLARGPAASQADPWGPLPQVHVSIKATALAPLLTPYTLREGIDEAMSRLGPILDHARTAGRHHPPRQRARRGEGRHVRAAAGDRRGLSRRPAARLRRAGLPHRRLRRPARPDRLERGHAARGRCRSGW